MKEFRQEYLTGERALFGTRDISLYDTTFADGESPLKESADIRLYNCLFKWKYPLWYSKDIVLEDCTLFQTARAGIWYTRNLTMTRCFVEAPKTFRRAEKLTLAQVQLPNASETLWHCRDVVMKQVTANGDYFGMNCENVEAEDFVLTGNYSFDGAKNVTIRRAKMLSKDAFWNTENVTVYDSFISGEYLGWNAKNLTLVGCTVESLQGLCYVENLVMKDCKLLNTDRAFEYSTVDADIRSKIDSVVNPAGGVIRADGIGSVTLEEERVDPSRTRIEIRQ